MFEKKCFGAHYALMLHLFCDMLSLMTKRRYITISILEREKRLCVSAATLRTKDFYFGRTLDYEFSYGEEIVITPRNYEFNFRHMGQAKEHYAIIGMAHVAGDYPLYYDAINEKGIGMAGLNFVGNAVYAEVTEGKENVASFEFIPWMLRQCATMDEVRAHPCKNKSGRNPVRRAVPGVTAALDHRRRK